MHNFKDISRTASVCLVAAAALSLAACGSTRHNFSSGISGINGADGQQGPQGEPGPQGPAGLDGLDGLDGVGDLLGGVGTVTIGDQTLANGENGPLGVSILSPDQATGQVLTAGVASGGQLVTIGTGNGATAATGGGTPDGLLGVNLGGNQIGSGNALIGLGVLSPTAAQGSSITGNVLSGGQPVGVGVGGAPAPSGGTTPGVGGVLAPLAPLTSPLRNLLRRN